MTTVGLTVALIGAPLLLGLAGLVLPQRNRPAGAAFGVLGAGLALALVTVLLIGFDGPREGSFIWVEFGEFEIMASVLVDRRALFMALAVAVVAFCVQVYSISYLRGDDRYGPYAAQVSIFTAAMLTVVFSGDLIMLLIGWEVMGACSYLLIAHDRSLPEAPAAAVKAFLVTRVGDVGFLLGVIWLGAKVGSFRISEVLDAVPTLDSTTITVAALLLLAGVAGKSAQFPLHTWLPDAMAGPTPISALIHAATMVAAGVYVVARLFPLYDASPVALNVLAIMAGITLLLGALAATGSDDIKRVLAWSTVSQLGYMMAALAVRAVDAAMFHLLTHAAFKALLFLCAGSVIHAVGSNLMSRMGGLRRDMPLTFVTMAVGLAALVGVPPMAGFWSKEAIVAALSQRPFLLYAALAGIAVTAWYSTRLLVLTFLGERRVHGHEPDLAMTGPLVLLAIPAAGLGLGVYLAGDDLAHLDGKAVLPLVLAAAGIGLGWLMCRRRDPMAGRGWVGDGFGLNTVQRWVVVRPVVGVARAVRAMDVSGVDGIVMGIGRLTESAGAGLARWHRAALPRAFAGVLAGAFLLAVAGVTVALW
ncbi:NADH-quinone oxidoreductase subunit L [Allorhizocola rhizosphaerae]|uniref:NADH-quinone oxidoreductase subunit 5 family protein n=1 Tax=Allorhizocola rhizosphaerae TaxID=1872709 RepID=UPI000E3D6B15|nr:NADH-quinone oxidoreductase subunit L [Allorhizocola rhizosphaerae]